HPAVASDARPDRRQLAEQLVTSECHNSTCDLVSHPNDEAQRPAHAGSSMAPRTTVNRVAGPLQHQVRLVYFARGCAVCRLLSAHGTSCPANASAFWTSKSVPLRVSEPTLTRSLSIQIFG